MAKPDPNDFDWLGSDVEASFFRQVRGEGIAPPSSSVLGGKALPGDVLSGRFELKRIVGGGGMGAVFRAFDQRDGRIVAVKVLEKRLYADRFEREATILSELSHPGIVRYVAHGATPSGAPYLAMEWMEGEELAHRMLRSRLGAADSLRVVRRASDALAVVHARGIVHRDVKPSNLFLVGGDPDRTTVFDFGVARLDGNGISQRGDVIGTPGYMAPEQALAEDDVDARADVFALGCVLFECLTGAPAFGGVHPLAVLAEEPPRVGKLKPELAVLDPLLRRMLAKDREARPCDARALHAELHELERCLFGSNPAA
jgi:serine/threonine protein kinase